ncbi:hypothetical protein ECFRIK1996_2898, partial [Escherichia coli FRIK1996]
MFCFRSLSRSRCALLRSAGDFAVCETLPLSS